MILSVVIISHNEEANIGRTLASVHPLVADGKGEIIVVDSDSTDRTIEIAKSFGAEISRRSTRKPTARQRTVAETCNGSVRRLPQKKVGPLVRRSQAR